MLQATGLACTRGERCLFSGLDFELAPGQCLHIAGRNGAGKTTLLRIIAGLLMPTEGTVRWKGTDIRRSREEFGADLAFVGHLNGVKDDLSALENLRFTAALRGEQASVDAGLAALERVGLADHADIPARHLSQGQKRRVALARLCAPRAAALWILDEPFNALDSGAVATLNGLIERQMAAGGLVLLTAHQSITLPGGTRRLELAGAAGDERAFEPDDSSGVPA